MADPRPASNDLRDLQNQLQQIRKQLRNLSAPTDSQFNKVVQQMLQIINNIDQIVGDSINRTAYTKAQTDAAISAKAATLEPKIGILPTAKGGTNTQNGYNNLFSTGPWRAAWLLADGTLGTSQSSMKVKTDYHEPDISIAQLRSVDWRGFRYIDDVNQNSDSAIPRIGMFAEELDEAGLGVFVVYDDSTLEPISIDYASLSVAALHLAKNAHDRIDDLENRLTVLEKNMEEKQ
jgi:hypothetical protein